MNELSLFSGYGGLSLALKLTGIQTRTVAYVEWEKYPQEKLKARIKDKQEGKFGLDDAPIFSDIASFRGEQFRGVVDIITAGFPCPPFSQAGLQRGAEDPRNKWPDTLRVIREVAPRYVLLENVAGISNASRKRGTPSYGGVVVGQLAEAGYDCFWQIIGANDVGAPHRRKRWLCFGVLADPDSIESTSHTRDDGKERSFSQAQRQSEHSATISERDSGEMADSNSQRGRSGTTYWQDASDVGQPPQLEERHRGIPTWPPGPKQTDEWARILAERPDLSPALTKDALAYFRGVVDGRTHKLDELKALGNGVVPAVVAQFLKQLMR